MVGCLKRIKQLMKQSLKEFGYENLLSSNSSELIKSNQRRVTQGHTAVFVGEEEMCRFVIPDRYARLPALSALFKMSGEKFGYSSSGPIVLPCLPRFFKGVLELLRKDEKRYGKMKIEEFVKIIADDDGETQTEEYIFPALIKVVS